MAWRDRVVWWGVEAAKRLLALGGVKTIGARIIVVSPDQHVLLVRLRYFAGWYLPGGGVDKGETPLQAARREVAEEVGLLDPTLPCQLFGVYLNRREGRDDYAVVYVMQAPGRHQPPPHFEVAEARWWALDQLPADISPATRRRLAEYQAGGSRTEMW